MIYAIMILTNIFVYAAICWVNYSRSDVVYLVEDFSRDEDSYTKTIVGAFRTRKRATKKAIEYYTETKEIWEYPKEFDSDGVSIDLRINVPKDAWDRQKEVYWHNASAEELRDVYIYEVFVGREMDIATLNCATRRSVKDILMEV